MSALLHPLFSEILAAHIAPCDARAHKPSGPPRNPNLEYLEVTLDGIAGLVLVGFEYTRGEPANFNLDSPSCGPGEPECASVCEVWVGDRDIVTVMTDEAIEGLEAKLLECMADDYDEPDCDPFDRYDQDSHGNYY